MQYAKISIHFIRRQRAKMDRALDILNRMAQKNQALCAAGRWFLDHYPMLSSISEATHRDMGALPALPVGEADVHAPRAFVLAERAADTVMDGNRLSVFMNDQASVFSMQEIWLFPLLLKAAYLNHVAHTAQEVARLQSQWEKAEAWAQSFFNGHRPALPRDLSPAFLARLAQRIKEENPAALPEIAVQSTEKGLSPEEAMDKQLRLEAQLQSAMQTAIDGLRALEQLDIEALFISVSKVEQTLMEDPAGVYGAMEPASRAYLRGQVERIAHKAKVSELEAAQAALKLSQSQRGPQTHIGWALTDGQKELGRSLGIRLPGSRKKLGRFLYPISAVLLTGLIWALFFPLWKGPLAGAMRLFSLLPIGAIVQSILQWLLTHLKAPTHLCKLHLPTVPDDMRTLVVIPALITDPQRIQALTAHLEALVIANEDTNIDWLLLLDYRDSASVHADTDNALQSELQHCLGQAEARLNRCLFALTRPRTWSQTQQRYMGYERKRGALVQLHDLLLRGHTEAFIHSRDVERIQQREYTYILSLDADTLLPPGAVKRLIGTIGHPLQQKTPDKPGFAVLSPRMGTSLRGIDTRLQALFSSRPGVDSYGGNISDVYMDICGQGIFCGKGIYHLRDFDAATRHLPENKILSHDLLEGSLSGAGYVSDIVLYDSLPATYTSYVQRMHRWARGDWQLLPWILLGKGVPPLNRFMMLDNLRRTLTPISLLLLVLFAGIAASPLALGLALLTGFWPVLDALTDIGRPGFVRRMGHTLAQSAIAWALLPYEAVMLLDAILRSLWRMGVSKRHLLDWVTAADADAHHPQRNRLFHAGKGFWALCMISAFLAGGGIILILSPQQATAYPFYRSFLLDGLWGAAVLGGIFALATLPWVFGPNLAQWLNRRQADTDVLSSEDERTLRTLTCRMWLFFEHHVGKDTHYLPPDNVQLNPYRGVALRTSPTNTGLYLTACLSAYELGYIDAFEMADRIEDTISTLESLPKWKGHPYNWIALDTLEPMRPRYVSSVDGGNLAACLWLAATQLREVIHHPLVLPQRIQGIVDRLTLSLEEDADPAPAKRALDFLDSRQEAMPLLGLKELLRGLEGATQGHGLQARRACERAYADALKRGARVSDIRSKEAFLSLGDRCDALVEQMDFAAFYDPVRKLFAIGMDAEHNRMSESYYDLMASEARSLFYVAVAKGDVPAKAFYGPGRALTRTLAGTTLLSWSGTYFEYAMPELWLSTPKGSLIHESVQAATRMQFAHPVAPGAAFGVSESGYYAFDLDKNYQYRAFGIPALALDGNLPKQRVVAPYASFLALMFSPSAAMENIRRMQSLGWQGLYGLYEAADYTPERMEGDKPALVESFMSHHQGMALCAAANQLSHHFLRALFRKRSAVRAYDLLLEEALPNVPVRAHKRLDMGKWAPVGHGAPRYRMRVKEGNAHGAMLLDGGGTTALMFADGRGYLAKQGRMLNRWRLDPRWWHGIGLYIRLNGEKAFSAYGSAEFEPGCVRYAFKQGGLAGEVRVYISPEEGTVIHRISMQNISPRPLETEITSFFEIALSPQKTDEAHAAFQNLFVSTEFLEDFCALCALRRPRDKGPTPALIHGAVQEGAAQWEYEIDRAAFLGRGRTAANPVSLHQPLSCQTGTVLDPCAALRKRFTLMAGEKQILYFVTNSYDDSLQARAGLQQMTPAALEAALSMAKTHAQARLAYLDQDEKSWKRSLRLLSLLHRPTSTSPYRQWTQPLGQKALWPMGLSGDLPMVVVQVESLGHMNQAEKMLAAHESLGLQGFHFDLVLLNEYGNDYLQPLGDRLNDAVAFSLMREKAGKPGGVHLLAASSLGEKERQALEQNACLWVEAGISLDEYLLQPFSSAERPRILRTLSKPAAEALPDIPVLWDNAFGGATAEGGYLIHNPLQKPPPAPWCNVLAGEGLSCLVTERGMGPVWGINSREDRITPWHGDPVSDPQAEALYLMDMQAGTLYSATPAPCGPGTRTLHHAGYTVYENRAGGIDSHLKVWVDAQQALRILEWQIRNEKEYPRKFSGCYFVEWGLSSEGMLPLTLTGYEPGASMAWAKHPHAQGMVYAAVQGQPISHYTLGADVFLGGGTLAAPERLASAFENAWPEQGGKPCAALQWSFIVPPGGQVAFTLLLGREADLASARKRVMGFSATASWENTRVYWERRFTGLQINTPDKKLDYLVNHWLPTQIWSARYMGRAGYYQPGGAYGFRDQLQDALAFLLTDPQEARTHILRCAEHQFVQGDVQHWWHPPYRGVRTHISDDLLFLPYAIAEYLRVTGDESLLLEEVPWLLQEELPLHEEDAYQEPSLSQETSPLIEHGMRALKHACRFGPHGLPLMGGGDWNDGMNAVGREGKGESIWLGFFLLWVLEAFLPCVQAVDRWADAEWIQEMRKKISAALDNHAWDGQWYRRAYFDDGTPLGSQESVECRIDAVAQAWAVLSGHENKERARQGVLAAYARLYMDSIGVLKLLDPPFNGQGPYPGYISGYVPGVRENGGQYTHGAIWLAAALFRLNETEKAMTLLSALNPLNHGDSYEAILQYRVEPYVLSADIYTQAPHKGRGGWSWYTGSAGWMWRLVIEELLGIRVENHQLWLHPSYPLDWENVSFLFKWGKGEYHIQCVRLGKGKNIRRILLDGQVLENDRLPLDPKEYRHTVCFELGNYPATEAIS